jgi:hypothetical protein
MARIVFATAAALAAVALAGCSAKPPAIVPVEAVVRLNGAPLPKIKLLFYPQAQFNGAADYIAQGVTDDRGRVKLTCHGQDGACVGENLVAVIDEIPDELTATSAREQYYAYMKSLKNRPVPDQFRSAATSPVRVTVTAGQSEYKVDLKR